ncbi:LysR family transcriptional regulator [Prosthecomicrobium sp. N25]|uniref:LysR family transcriptional regulator n=1 Tax=Prosthecomicrobium sp. N25 TaxID=3129254 RepID=UPI0030777AB9
MRMRDMEAAIAVYECGSFSKAAEVIGTSQPAVSMAVQRLEKDLKISLFDRTGAGVRATQEGSAAIKAFLKITNIIDELRDSAETNTLLKIGVTPLLSGRDVTRMLQEAFPDHTGGLDVEFCESSQILGRQDLDVRVTIPSLRKKSAFCIELRTAWIGVDNGIFIFCRQEAEVWQRARSALLNSGYPVRKTITVNDCGYAYHMAAAGAGFTPCVMTRGISFQNDVLTTLPELPPARIDIFAQYDMANQLRAVLSTLD